MPKVSVIIINYNTAEMTERVIRNFYKMEPELDFELILIDNASREPIDPEKMRGLVNIFIANRENMGFSPAVCQGLAESRGGYVLLLNSDVLIHERSVSRLAAYLDAHKSAGIIAPQMIYPGGKIQASFGLFPNIGREIMRFFMLSKIFPGGTLIFPHRGNRKYYTGPARIDWVSGGCLLLRRKLADEIGGFDPEYFFGVEDFDFCWRAKKAGWQVMYNPESKVTHYHGFSSGGRRSTFSLRLEARGFDRFYRKNMPEQPVLRLTVKYLYFLKANILDVMFKIIRNKK